MLVSLVVLFGGWQAYQRLNLVNPLKTKLQTIQGVQSVQVVNGNPNVITVQLGKVKDLQTTYHSLTQTITETLGSNQPITILDHRNSILTQDDESLQPIILEGLAKGNYVEMILQVKQAAVKLGINVRVTMDSQNVFVQLEQGSYYLYDVQSYHLPGTGGAAS
jgi:hypothetical protein